MAMVYIVDLGDGAEAVFTDRAVADAIAYEYEGYVRPLELDARPSFAPYVPPAPPAPVKPVATVSQPPERVIQIGSAQVVTR